MPQIKEKAKTRKFLNAESRLWIFSVSVRRQRFNHLRKRQADREIDASLFRVSRLSSAAAKILCLADYFASKDSGKIDVVAFDLVTMGRTASEYAAELFKNDNYTDYLLFHGLSVESAEALAEMWHKKIRTDLGFAQSDASELTKLFHQGYQGSRYSFGYPACPNLEDQTKLFELLQPERIDVELSEEFQLHPEQSTSAIIIHHPQAKYFNIE
ncbi:MAG: vitamin B12 dependent-methionine synthase activation domain-containing protein [Pyrinomonadaceae bacterium]